MVLYSKFLGLQTYLTLLLMTAALLGDYLVGRVRLQWSRALIDNATHAVVGGLSLAIVCVHFRQPNVWEILQCTILSSLIDVDHFIRVQSFNLLVGTVCKRISQKIRKIICAIFVALYCYFRRQQAYLIDHSCTAQQFR